MAKLLCTLFLAGFVFQANAFRVSADPPNPNWVSNIADFFNPVNWVHKFPIMNPMNWIPGWVPGWIPKWIPGFGKDRCLLPVVKGPCFAYMTRYYYDKETKQCVEFKYGGCKGNRNNFKRKDVCEKVCVGH